MLSCSGLWLVCVGGERRSELVPSEQPCNGAGFYSVSHTVRLGPSELTNMWDWILLRTAAQRRGRTQSSSPVSKGLVTQRKD